MLTEYRTKNILNLSISNQHSACEKCYLSDSLYIRTAVITTRKPVHWNGESSSHLPCEHVHCAALIPQLHTDRSIEGSDWCYY